MPPAGRPLYLLAAIRTEVSPMQSNFLASGSRRAALGLIVPALLIGLCGESFGRVKLITLPVRERVEIQLDNPGATLVEEERIVPLVKGENQVDFSWANTQIDPNTIVFRVVAPVGEKMLDVKVLSVSYPPNEAALIWTVGSSD